MPLGAASVGSCYEKQLFWKVAVQKLAISKNS